MQAIKRLDGVAESRPTSYSFILESNGENETITFSMKVQANNINKFIDIVAILLADAKRVSCYIETAIDIKISRGIAFHTFKLSSDCVWLEVEQGYIEFNVPGYSHSIRISVEEYIKQITKLAYNIAGWDIVPLKPYTPVLVKEGVKSQFAVFGVNNNKIFGGYTIVVQRGNFMVLSSYSATGTRDGKGKQLTRVASNGKKRYLGKLENGGWVMYGGKVKFEHVPPCVKLDNDSSEFILL